MKSKIELLAKKYKSLIESELVNFDYVSQQKNITGVYVIYNEHREILYIGNTNKFNIRFGTDLKHETTHTLVRKLIKNGEFKDRYEILDYLKNKCSIKIEVCETKREAEALEGIAIYCLNPILNK
ncbi:MAG: hypothetical protein CMC96_00315 [Flavobacteriales bacterium]|nr:hypothetical protein [Flavobacteriales bacterium]|tara:strand:+ start:56 stop:430 length:375 start_codon:yes stop_codon:yes gene_type:complete